MKEQIIQRLEAIPEEDCDSLMMFASSLTENITSYFYLGVDEGYQEYLKDFRIQSTKLLNLYETPETYQQDDIYWLLYWACEDTSLQTTYNGYNYLHMLLSPSLQTIIQQINLKNYIETIVKIIKKENFKHC